MYNTDKPLKIAISGAGLLGRLLAWQLLELKHQVSLFEAGSIKRSPSAAHTAAAMISPLSEVVVSDKSIYDHGMRSLAIWPEWTKQLEEETAIKLGYRACGSLVVAHPQDKNELSQFRQELDFHLGELNRTSWLSKEELKQYEPDLAGTFDGALFLPDEAYLDNRALLEALIKRIDALGGDCKEYSALNFGEDQINHAAAKRVYEPNDLNSFDLFIDCRGVGAKYSTDAVRGVRGEVLWVKTEEVNFKHPIRLMHPRYKIYIVPKPNNCYIIGATEIESEDRSPMSVQSMMELCSALYTLNPAFAEARIQEIDANLRPATLDNLPLVSRRAVADGRPLVSINGLYRHGFLLAPSVIQEVNELIFK